MQCFYEAWRIVQAFLYADAQVPKEVALPIPAHRELCRILAERREYPVLEVVDAIAPFGQRGLMDTVEVVVESEGIKGESNTTLIVAPESQPKLI
jgi:hypothetical protein